MKRISIFLFFLLLTGFGYAKTVEVQKIVENREVKVGDNVTVFLKFKNPFDKDVVVRITDKNIIGNNGLNIECLEYVVPAKRESTLAYEPIMVLKAGEYTLNGANITYVNPETGKTESIKSNSIKITVKRSNKTIKGQGITTIYRCNGINLRSTSFSTTQSYFNVQVTGSQIKKNVVSNQLNQNVNVIKNQLEREVEQQKKIKEEFQKNIIKNKKFQKEHSNLTDMGYNITDISLNPVTNDTGTFEFTYQNQKGKRVTIKGEMKNGTIERITLQREEKEKVLNALYNNKKFQKYDRELKNQGYSKNDPILYNIGENRTKIVVPYSKGKESRNITAEYVNGEVKDVKVEGSSKWWIICIIVLITVIALIMMVFYRKEYEISNEVKQEDYVERTKNMLLEAEKFFEEGKEKDAYSKISQAIRFYFINLLGLRREITNTELIYYLKKSGIDVEDVERCLNLCSYVEFARYRAKKKDFEEVLNTARRVLESTQKDRYYNSSHEMAPFDFPHRGSNSEKS